MTSRKWLIVAIAFASQTAFAAPIKNFFELQSEPGKVFRGAEPALKDIPFLKEKGVTNVLIFKNDTNGKVALEKKALEKVTISVKHVEFLWKDIEDQEAACAQAIDALNYVLNVSKQKDKGVFFHCTAGEDRTGLLAGLFQIATGKMKTTKEAFDKELCAHGFANGHRGKTVGAIVTKELYPVFLMAVNAIQTAKEKNVKLTGNLCAKDSISTLVKSPACTTFMR